jgi:hypothetical protein
MNPSIPHINVQEGAFATSIKTIPLRTTTLGGRVWVKVAGAFTAILAKIKVSGSWVGEQAKSKVGGVFIDTVS